MHYAISRQGFAFMTGADLIYLIVWVALVLAGALLNAATWIVTGNFWNLVIAFFAACTAMWLIESNTHTRG